MLSINNEIESDGLSGETSEHRHDIRACRSLFIDDSHHSFAIAKHGYNFYAAMLGPTER
jgi:hypothetical protein